MLLPLLLKEPSALKSRGLASIVLLFLVGPTMELIDHLFGSYCS